MNVLVLGGGNSPERDVSLRSAKSVANAAREAGLDVIEKDPVGGLGFLDSLPRSTIVLPILHGQGGEDGSLQKELEERGLPFLGSNSDSSARCFDKWTTLKALKTANLPIAERALVTNNTYRQNSLSKKPHVLKVRRGGSSIGTLIVRDFVALKHEEIDKLFELDSEAVLEELIEGTEVTIPVLDQTALPVIEIRPPEGLEFDYENKYNGLTAEICPPESVPPKLQEKSQRMSEQVHELMNCRHLSRVDIMIDKSGNLFVLEVNTMPGLTDQSLYPKSAAVAGLSMPELVKRFVELVKRDYSL
jgi:D-alanine-D-alanine ligase